NKTILITGVCGTIGRELLRLLADFDVKHIIGIDNNESELFFVTEDYKKDDRVQLFLGDLRDVTSLKDKMNGVDIVLHSAALKHVILCEQSPRDAIQTNILGTQNVIDAALSNNVERVIFTSSDKAVNPTNVMGTSKLMGERLMTAAHATTNEGGPIFSSTRFGNVLGSRGSVIPIFKRQISQGGPLTLTHPDMTRFIMTLEEACRLLLNSVFIACGGEVFITKMPICRIDDLANVLIKQSGNSDIVIEEIGIKPGEKLYEELMNEEETRRTVELDEYFSVLPAFTNIYRKINYKYCDDKKIGINNPYNSSVEISLKPEELTKFLIENGLVGEG
ncbi:MAG: SDR family NAD(P)-dependent oxidoreductase, partial [Kordiimonadaceae bacterium]|nr:SDR family NAD(P)-dependent oxidoreductase [Kordiimonadaceae bacterium]